MENISKRLFSLAIGTVCTAGLAIGINAVKAKISDVEMEKIANSYVSTDDDNFTFGNLYIIESDDDINICEVRDVDIVNEDEQKTLENFGIKYYDDISSIPDDIKSEIEHFNIANYEDEQNVRGCFLSPSIYGEGLELYDTMAMRYDIDSKKLIEPFDLSDDITLAEWVLPEYKLLFGDNTFTYDEVKDHAKTYLKK